MDKIDDLVARAIAYTDDILSRGPEHWESARDGLIKMRESLEIGAPNHPALERLRLYIEELEARGGGRTTN